MNRYLSVDVARGVIMIIMAIDHCAGPFAAGRSPPEIALPGVHFTRGNTDPVEYTRYTTIGHQITREVTHICAPGFQFLAGVGLAISVSRSRRQGVGEARISGEMLVRAAVLFFAEWVLMHVAYGFIWFLFLVLCCIGSAVAIFSVARFLPLPVIFVASVAVLLGQPLYAPAQVVFPTAAEYLRNIWTGIASYSVENFIGPNRVETMAWVVMYPVLPWVGYFGLGWCLGTLYERRPQDRFGWLPLAGLACLAAGVAVRWFGGSYGDRMPGGDLGPWYADFWVLAKYPPTPAFSLLTVGQILLLLGLLRPLDRSAERPSPLWQIPAVFGRVALFYFVVHFYLYGAAWYFTAHYMAGDQFFRFKLGLPETYAIWAAGLVLLWPVCYRYDKLRQKYRGVLRYC
jgi:uncharacterized membrane protein